MATWAYHSWYALLVLLGSPDAQDAVVELAGDPLLFRKVHAIAHRFLRATARTTTNEAADRILESTLAELRQRLSETDADRLRNLADELRPDTSGLSGQANLWLLVLNLAQGGVDGRSVPRHPWRAQEEQAVADLLRRHARLQVRLCSAPMAQSSQWDLDWRSLVGDLLDRRAFRELIDLYQGMGRARRAKLVAWARGVASARGIPPELLTSPLRTPSECLNRSRFGGDPGDRNQAG